MLQVVLPHLQPIPQLVLLLERQAIKEHVKNNNHVKNVLTTAAIVFGAKKRSYVLQVFQ